MEISLVNVALLFLFLTQCISLLENQLKWKRIPILPKKRFDFQILFVHCPFPFLSLLVLILDHISGSWTALHFYLVFEGTIWEA